MIVVITCMFSQSWKEDASKQQTVLTVNDLTKEEEEWPAVIATMVFSKCQQQNNKTQR